MHLIDDIEYIKKHKQTAPNTYAYEVKYVNKESTMLIADLSSKIVDYYWKWFNNKSMYRAQIKKANFFLTFQFFVLKKEMFLIKYNF